MEQVLVLLSHQTWDSGSVSPDGTLHCLCYICKQPPFPSKRRGAVSTLNLESSRGNLHFTEPGCPNWPGWPLCRVKWSAWLFAPAVRSPKASFCRWSIVKDICGKRITIPWIRLKAENWNLRNCPVKAPALFKCSSWWELGTLLDRWCSEREDGLRFRITHLVGGEAHWFAADYESFQKASE